LPQIVVSGFFMRFHVFFLFVPLLIPPCVGVGGLGGTPYSSVKTFLGDPSSVVPIRRLSVVEGEVWPNSESVLGDRYFGLTPKEGGGERTKDEVCRYFVTAIGRSPSVDESREIARLQSTDDLRGIGSRLKTERSWRLTSVVNGREERVVARVGVRVWMPNIMLIGGVQPNFLNVTWGSSCLYLAVAFEPIILPSSGVHPFLNVCSSAHCIERQPQTGGYGVSARTNLVLRLSPVVVVEAAEHFFALEEPATKSAAEEPAAKSDDLEVTRQLDGDLLSRPWLVTSALRAREVRLRRRPWLVDSSESEVSDGSGLLHISPAVGPEYPVPFSSGRLSVDDSSLYQRSGDSNSSSFQRITVHLARGGLGVSLLRSICIPSVVTCIEERAFSDCVFLADVCFASESSLLEIENCAFSGSMLREIIIPRSVEILHECCFYNCASLVSVEFEKASRLKEIGPHAFCRVSLRRIEIPAGVQELRASSFYGCDHLSSITFCEGFSGVLNSSSFLTSRWTDHSFTADDSYRAVAFFDRVYSPLVEFSLSNTLVSFIPSLFFSSSHLADITIPSFVSSIGDLCFFDCSDLCFVQFEGFSVLHTICCSAFSECTKLRCLNIPSSVRHIESHCFAGCTNLESVLFDGDSQLEEIEEKAFLKCGITKIDIPRFVFSIGRKCFGGCQNLNSVQFSQPYHGHTLAIHEDIFAKSAVRVILFPASLREVPAFSFSKCANLDRVEFGAGLTTINHDAFYHSTVSTVTIPASVTSLKERCFAGCENLESIDFSECGTLLQIPTECFLNSGLKSFAIPSSVTLLQEACFSHCSCLESIKIESDSNLEKIEPCAFQLSGLTSIFIPPSVIELGHHCFFNCVSLESVTFYDRLNSKLTTIGAYAFFGSKLRGLEVPPLVNSIGESCFAWGDCFSHPICFSKVETVPAFFSWHDYLAESVICLCRIEAGPFSCAFRDFLSKSDFCLSKVETVPASCFANCRGLTVMPRFNLLVEIGERAFCATGFRNVTIPARVIKLGSHCFASCIELTKVTFESGSGLQELSDHTFDGCVKLVKVAELPKKVAEPSKKVAEPPKEAAKPPKEAAKPSKKVAKPPEEVAEPPKKVAKLPESVKTIGRCCFLGCRSLRVVVCPATALIGASAFESTGVVDLDFSPNLRQVPSRCFFGCKSLRNVKFATNAPPLPILSMTLFPYAFSQSSLRQINIPMIVTSLPEGCFCGCRCLEAVIFELVPPSQKRKSYSLVTSIGPRAFAESGIKEIAIPSSVEVVGAECFRGCKSLASVSFCATNTLSKLNHIGHSAFAESGITAMQVPNGVVLIPAYFCSNCPNLVKLSFDNGSSLRAIGRCAFSLSGLIDILVPPTVRLLCSECFSNCLNVKTVTLLTGAASAKGQVCSLILARPSLLPSAASTSRSQVGTDLSFAEVLGERLLTQIEVTAVKRICDTEGKRIILTGAFAGCPVVPDLSNWSLLDEDVPMHFEWETMPESQQTEGAPVPLPYSPQPTKQPKSLKPQAPSQAPKQQAPQPAGKAGPRAQAGGPQALQQATQPAGRPTTQRGRGGSKHVRGGKPG
jgi:hypothetical protein